MTIKECTFIQSFVLLEAKFIVYLHNFLFYYKCKTLRIYNLQFDSSIVLQKMDQFDGVSLELEDCAELLEGGKDLVSSSFLNARVLDF